MKKNIVKIATVLMVLAVIIFTFTNVFASAAPDPNGFQGGSADTGKIEDIGNQIITIVSTIGSIVSVIVLVVLGLKYMMGSAEEKAEYKRTLLPYVIGAGLVFAASAIAGVIFSFTNGLAA